MRQDWVRGRGTNDLESDFLIDCLLKGQIPTVPKSDLTKDRGPVLFWSFQR